MAPKTPAKSTKAAQNPTAATTNGTSTTNAEVALTTALEALARGARDEVLASLIEAWRVRRSPVLASMIDGLSIELGGVPLYPIDASREDRIDAWDQAARSPSVVDIGRLAATLVDGVRAGDTADRIHRFGALEPDPRIALAYQKMIAVPPWTASSNGKIWTEFLGQLTGHHADPRAIAMIRGIEGRYLDIFGRSVMGEKIQKAIVRVASDLEKRFPPGSVDAEGREKEIEEQLTQQLKVKVTTASVVVAQGPAPIAITSGKLDSPEAWAVHIAEAPDDDDRVDAFAKWLTNRGDPRAEFMDIQLRRHRGLAVSNADERREKNLLKKHQKQWLGPVAFAVPGTPQEFERGLLTDCYIAFKGKFTAQAVGHPIWATVKRVHAHYKKDILFLIGHPIFKSLISIEGAPEDLFFKLASSTQPRKIEEISLIYGPHPGDLDERFDAPGLPSLRVLQINAGNGTRVLTKASGSDDDEDYTADRYVPFLRSPLVTRLEHLKITEQSGNASDWFAVIQKHVPQNAKPIITVGASTIKRAPKGGYTDLTLEFEGKYLWSFLDRYESFDPSGFTRIEFRQIGPLETAKKDLVDRYRALVKRCSGHAETTLTEV